MEMQYIIYMQEACGPPHIDHYRLFSLHVYKKHLLLNLHYIYANN